MYSDKIFKLRSLTEEDQIKKFGEVLITPDTELELVKARSKYALASNIKVIDNPDNPYSHGHEFVEWEDEISPELFYHPYANKLGYTDVYPYEVIKHNTARKMTVRLMDAELDPDWKMDMVPGGFVGHVTNNRTQSYTYTSNETNDVREIRYSKAKNKRGWFDKYGNRYSVNTAPYKFHDYNF